MVNRQALVARAAAAAFLVAFAVLINACKPTAAPVAAHPGLSRPPVGTGAGAAGSITVTVTRPVAVSGHVDTTVTCTTTGHTYNASASGALVGGYRIAFTTRVIAYRGAGTYPDAVVSLTLDGPGGTIGSGGIVTPATVTASGGSFTLDTTDASGQTFAASVRWACSGGSR
jgi:hypothetical protein